MKIVKKIKVKNSLGLHIRPASAIVKLLQQYESDVSFTYNRMTINARSIMSILMLVAKKNTKIVLTINGKDADLVCKELENIFDQEFGEK
jgi:phosphocarrier protein HPr